MKFLLLSAIAVVAIFVKAQDACILNCTATACPTNEIACLCTTGSAEIAACIQENCPPEDLQIALGLQQSVCGINSPLVNKSNSEL
jgi:hypothetical protein